MQLLLTVLSATVAEPEGEGAAPASWSDAQAAMAACGKVDEDVELAVTCEDADALRAILATWLSNKLSARGVGRAGAAGATARREARDVRAAAGVRRRAEAPGAPSAGRGLSSSRAATTRS